MKMMQWWWDIEDRVISIVFWTCMAAIFIIVMGILAVGISTLPGFMHAAGLA